jgi:hypothetical protein
LLDFDFYSQFFFGLAKKIDPLFVLMFDANKIIFNYMRLPCGSLSLSYVKTNYNYNINHPQRRATMASKDKAKKEERKKPQLTNKERRKAKDEKKKSTSVTNTGA